jgi:hypothetical protein
MNTKQALAIAIPVTVAATIGATIGIKAITQHAFDVAFNGKGYKPKK